MWMEELVRTESSFKSLTALHCRLLLLLLPLLNQGHATWSSGKKRLSSRRFWSFLNSDFWLRWWRWWWRCNRLNFGIMKYTLYHGLKKFLRTYFMNGPEVHKLMQDSRYHMYASSFQSAVTLNGLYLGLDPCTEVPDAFILPCHCFKLLSMF